MLFRLAFRNIFRNFRRTFLTSLSIAFSVMIVIFFWSFAMGIFGGLFDNFVRSTSGHVRIVNREYLRHEKMMPLDYNINGFNENDSYLSVEKIAQSDPDALIVTSRIKFGVLLDYIGENKPVMGMGIDPEKEKGIIDLSRRIIAGRQIKMGKEEINIGDRMAQDLNLKLGSTLTIVTQTAYGSVSAMDLKVVGIFSFGTPTVDRKTFYIPLDKGQQLLDMSGRVTEIIMLVKDGDKSREIAARINQQLGKNPGNKYAAIAWQDQGAIFAFFVFARNMYGFIYLLLIVLSSFTILNTMFMSVLERTKEIGMLKAMGMRDRKIILLVIYEALMIGLLASFIGAMLGAGLSYYFAVHGIDLTETIGQVDRNLYMPYVYRSLFKWSFVITGFLFGVFFSVLASIPPALRAAKLKPTEALHET